VDALSIVPNGTAIGVVDEQITTTDRVSVSLDFNILALSFYHEMFHTKACYYQLSYFEKNRQLRSK
jgi:hypothetical protein